MYCSSMLHSEYTVLLHAESRFMHAETILLYTEVDECCTLKQFLHTESGCMVLTETILQHTESRKILHSEVIAAY